MRPLVICGGGMAAAKLIRELKNLNYVAPIVLISEEPIVGYNRVLLPDYLAGKRPLAELRQDTWFEDMPNLTIRTNIRATDLDLDSHRVCLSDGTWLAFDKLVLATGAAARIPDIPGSELAGVGALRNLQDVSRLSEAKGKRTMVVGGGLLGLEAAHALNDLGHEVVVVHRNHWILNKQIDQAAGAKLQLAMEAEGVRFVLNESVHKVIGHGCVEAVLLGHGETFKLDNLLFAVGSVPCSQLGGKELRRHQGAYEADHQMRTSDPLVFALGECASVCGTRSALVGTVNEQAKTLATVLSGRDASYVDPVATTRLKVGSAELVVAGQLQDKQQDDVLLASDEIYRRFSFNGDELLGVVMFGDTRGAAKASAAIGEKFTTSRERFALACGS